MQPHDTTIDSAAESAIRWWLRERRRQRVVLVVLVLALVVTVISALAIGSVSIDWRSFVALLGDDGSTVHRSIVFDLRLPRVLAAALVGAALALAGVQMQVLIRNPLADPYVLGIAGGAAVGALLAMVLLQPSGIIQIAAACGALLSMGIVLFLGRGVGPWSPTRLLLTGVVVSAGWGAVISFLLAIGPGERLRGMLFWLMGDFSGARVSSTLVVVVALGLIVSIILARSMNVLAVGRNQAAVLGLEVDRLRLVLYLVASVLTATAVTVAGSIGFVGLVVPHMMRLLGGADHRWLVPASFVAGAILLVLADTLARTVLAPQQLPVGVLTAFAGVPVFLYLLWRGAK